jgi:hypothetical protein
MPRRPSRTHRRRLALASIVSLAAVGALSVAAAVPAGACGGLVGQNGTIELVRTTTLAAYHDGVERYVTSFEFTGEGEEVGSIVPLPDVPTDVERGGDWTLQRLSQEVAPPPEADAFDRAEATTLASDVDILIEAEIDALDITVLRGGGSEVGKWAVDNGFFLTPDAPEVLDFYAERSPVFMAAKFDASRAAEIGQTAGQGTPIMLTIPTDEPWVPLRILGLGLEGSQEVEADVFVLTDDEPKLLAGGPGLSFGRSEPASTGLLDDLRSDKGMEWVPDDMWLSYLTVGASAADLDYDLAISANEGSLPSLERAGIPAPEARTIAPPDPGMPLWPLGVGLVGGFVALVAVLVVRGRSPVASPAPVSGSST